MNTTEDSAAMDTKDKCPHCGHPRLVATDGDGFLCGSHGEWKSPECLERAARKKAEKELAHMTFQADRDHARWKLEADDLAKERDAHAETRRKLEEVNENLVCYRDACLRQNADIVKAKETEKHLMETSRKLEVAANLIKNLKPYLRHNHPRCVTLCECGLNKVIMDAGRNIEKGGGV